ncbi:MAG: phosphatase [Oscillospiraceae bacterium]|nr:phosphatase [Oscillospiraceae bacterium]
MGQRRIDLGLVNEDERKIIEARRAYQRAWRAANKDRVAEHNRRFWAKKAAQIKAENKSE